MAKIILDEEALDRVSEHIAYRLRQNFLAALEDIMKQRKEEATPRPDFLRKMIVKGPGEIDGNGNRKRG